MEFVVVFRLHFLVKLIQFFHVHRPVHLRYRGHQLFTVLRQDEVSAAHLAGEEVHDASTQLPFGTFIPDDIIQVDGNNAGGRVNNEPGPAGQHFISVTSLADHAGDILCQQLLGVITTDVAEARFDLRAVDVLAHVGEFRYGEELCQLGLFHVAGAEQHVADVIPGTVVPPFLVIPGPEAGRF